MLTNVTDFVNEDHIMFTMGQDFTYQDASMHFKNLDKLIKHMNALSEETNIHVMYSTPSCYMKALSEVTTDVYPTKTDDFIPYATSKSWFRKKRLICSLRMNCP